MSSKQINIVFSVTVAVALLWLSAPYWGRSDEETLPISQARILFNAERAHEIAREFVTRNPRRVLGSNEAWQAAGFIQSHLRSLGYQVSFTGFSAVIGGRRQTGRNAVAILPGTVPEILVAVAHYDTAPTTFQGAADNGAGVGVLLELARVFADSPLRHSLIILASDGEEWGMLGAADIAEHYPERERIAAVLSLDGVGPGDLSELRLDAEGQRSGYAPSWLRRLASRAAESQGQPVVSPSGFTEDVQRALELSRTDQGPFLNAGIPAINLGSRSVDSLFERRIYHSQDDTIVNIKPASVGKYGAAAERILRSIDEVASIPAGTERSFRWRNDTFLAEWAMTLLQYASFLPLVVMLGFAWVNYRQTLGVEKILREMTFFLAWLAPVVLILTMVLFCRLMHLIPRYSLYPGPQKDPVLANPYWGVIAAILAIAVVIAVGLHFLVRFLMRAQPQSSGASKLTLMALLLLVVVIALQYNPYWALTFLIFPALIWGTVAERTSLGARLLGSLTIVAAGFVLYTLVILSARSQGLGWNLVWYVILGLSTGMFQWQGFFLSAFVFVLGLRFLSLQLSTR